VEAADASDAAAAEDKPAPPAAADDAADDAGADEEVTEEAVEMEEEGDEEPLTKADFKAAMVRVVQAAKDGKGLIHKAIGALGKLIDSKKEDKVEAFHTVVTSFRKQMIHNMIAKNAVAAKLMHLMVRLYLGGGDFKEADTCHHMRDFKAKLEAPEDKAKARAYVVALAASIKADLQCFAAQYDRDEAEIDTEVMTAGDPTEAHAAQVVFKVLKGLHLRRLNAIRLTRRVRLAAKVLKLKALMTGLPEVDELKAKIEEELKEEAGEPEQAGEEEKAGDAPEAAVGMEKRRPRKHRGQHK